MEPPLSSGANNNNKPAMQLQRTREVMLANDRQARVSREIWSCRRNTYSAYRSYLFARGDAESAARHNANASEGTAPDAGGSGCSTVETPHAPKRPEYEFAGVKFISSDSMSAITSLSFAKLTSELLAYGNEAGELWLARLPGESGQVEGVPQRSAHGNGSHQGGGQDGDTDGAGGGDGDGGSGISGESSTSKNGGDGGADSRIKRYEPVVVKLPKVHAQSVVGLDWSFDNSQLLSVGADGALCMWDTIAGSCIRSMATRVPINCLRMHKLNPNMAVVGSIGGTVELINCSTGVRVQRASIASTFDWSVGVTSVEVSNHHVFIGDSGGNVHLLRSEMHNMQLKPLVRGAKLHVSHATRGAAVVVLQYVPFCPAADSPLLMAVCTDGTLALVKVCEHKHRMELHRWCVAQLPPHIPAAAPSQQQKQQAAGKKREPERHPMRATVCQLSVFGSISKLPLVCMGAPDTTVQVLDISAKPSWGVLPRPSSIATLKGHTNHVAEVSLSFDESLLASGDAGGAVIVWTRSSSKT